MLRFAASVNARKVPVARDERNTLIDTALGDQRIAETRLAALCEHLRAQRPRPLQ